MRLLFTYHAFVRMADWHPEYSGSLTGDQTTQSPDQARMILVMLKTFLQELGRGRPSTLTERLTQRKLEKYHHHSVYIFDRATGNIYQMVKDERGLVVVTVTYLEKKERIKVLDDPTPTVRVADVTEITLPYLVKGDMEIRAIDTPWAKQVPVFFGVQPNNPKALQKLSKKQDQNDQESNGEKISDHEFRMAVTEAYRQYLEAGNSWAQAEWKNTDQSKEKDQAHARMMIAEAKVMALLGTATGLYQTILVPSSIPEFLLAARNRKKA